MPDSPKAVIQFNCGTATKKEFYLPFLTYLAHNGYLCCLWNYRGSEQNDQLKGCDYHFSDYGTMDMPAIKAYLVSRFPELPFFFVAHSAGGQQIGFMPNLTKVKGSINIAVSSGYYPNMPFGYRMKAYFFFYLFAPLSALFHGYIKAKPYGFMENLPRNVAFEWRDWLEKETYFFHKKFYGVSVPIGQFKNFSFPIYVYHATDDSISNAKNTRAFWQNVHSKKGINIKAISPDQFGLKKIDHFGYFRKNMQDKLWPEMLKILDDLSGTNSY